MKDSITYKGSVLWNIVLYQEKQKFFKLFRADKVCCK